MRDFVSDFRSFATVSLGLDDYNRANAFFNELIEKKATEEQHVIDGDRERERWITGIMGELAMERFLGAAFIDWSVGESEDYDLPDLAGLNVAAGIKAVEYGKYPVVHRNPHRPEVIVVRDAMTFHICGLASPEVMRRHADDGLILNANLRAKGTKTGFWGFSELVPFSGLGELQQLSWKMAF